MTDLNPRPHTGRKSQKGFAMILVLALLAMAAVVGVSYVSTASVRMTATENAAKMSRAIYLAESGLHHAMEVLETSPWLLDGSDANSPVGPFFADGTNDSYVFYSVQTGPGNYVLYAQGTADGVDQTVTAKVHREEEPTILPSYAMFMDSGIAWMPDSLEVEGDIHVNGHIYNLARIDGDASAQGMIIDLRGGISGSQSPGVPYIDPPTIRAEDYARYYKAGYSRAARELSVREIDRYDDITDGGAVTASNPGGVVVVTPSWGSAVYIKDRVEFRGTLVVDGNLVLDGDDIELEAGEGFPALIVSGALYVKNGAQANIKGVVIVAQGIRGTGVTWGSETKITGSLVTDSYSYDLGLSGDHELEYDSDRATLLDFRPTPGSGKVIILSYGE